MLKCLRQFSLGVWLSFNYFVEELFARGENGVPWSISLRFFRSVRPLNLFCQRTVFMPLIKYIVDVKSKMLLFLCRAFILKPRCVLAQHRSKQEKKFLFFLHFVARVCCYLFSRKTTHVNLIATKKKRNRNKTHVRIRKKKRISHATRSHNQTSINGKKRWLSFFLPFARSQPLNLKAFGLNNSTCCFFH